MPRASSKDETVKIPPINRQRAVITIRGVTPLLCDRLSEQVIDAIEGAQTGAARGPKAPRDPEKEWQSKLYPLPEGGYGFPGSGIKKAMVNAGGRFADEQMTRLRGMFNVEADTVPIRGTEPKLRRDAGRLQGKTITPIYRAQFSEWEMDIPFSYNADLITVDQLANLVQFAGFSVGIGAWRPEKNGTFGQFEPVSVEERGA